MFVGDRIPDLISSLLIVSWQFITKLSYTKTTCGCIGANQLGASQIVLIDNLEGQLISVSY